MLPKITLKAVSIKETQVIEFKSIFNPCPVIDMDEKKNDDVKITPTRVIKNNAIKTFVLVLIVLFLVNL